MATVALVTPTRSTKAVARFAWVTLGFFILVVLWGAVVRATGSGGGCGSNWPLCNGDYFPHHPRLATIIEFTHRSTSGICTFLLAALGVFTFRVTPPGHRARKAVLWAALLLLTEALLGAMLVLRHYVEANISTGRVIAQSIHLTNTMLFMASLALTAWFLTPHTSATPSPDASRLIAILTVVSTLLVAATGSLAALADTLFPSSSLAAAFTADITAGSPILVRMRWMHPAMAVLSVVCVLLLLHATTLQRPIARVVLALLMLQFVFGIGDVLLLAPIWMQVIHLLGADLYWISLTLLVASIVWPAGQTERLAKSDL